MKFRFALSMSLLIVSAGAPVTRAQEGQTPSTQEVVKLEDLLAEAERVHPSTKVEAEISDPQNAPNGAPGLNDLIQEVLKKNPSIQTALRQVDAVRQRVPQVKTLPDTNTTSGTSWQSPARRRHWPTKTRGVLKIDEQGLEFRSGEAPVLKFSFLDVHTFFVAPHRLVIETYENRKHHMPGGKRYRFDLDQAVAPEVAAGLAREVQRPSQNAVPDPASPSAENIPARHRTRTGGTNGTLRIRDGGIDYVTSVPGDSRSWRWADLQTLSEPDPYHLFVFGYRDSYTFDLKEPISRALFNRMTDEIESHNASEQERRPEIQTSDLERNGREVGDE
jgi:hypothetical protein